MDCQMPGMDGYAATRAIRAWEEAHSREVQNRRIPIIAVTAHALAGDRDACIKSGMDDYLSKPLDPPVLVALIDRWLGRSRPAPERESDASPSASPREPDHAVVDYDALVDRCMGNVPLTERLVAKFRIQAEADLNALRDAIASGDKDTTAFHAHRMKGAAANLSAEAIRSAAAAIESKAKNDDMSGAAEAFVSLDAEIDFLRKYASPERSGAAV
jgi:two-component system sensor histidine kinase/response regulator